MNQTLDVALRAGKYARRPPLPHVAVIGCGRRGYGRGHRCKNAQSGAIALSVIRSSVRQPNGALKLLGVDTWGTYAEFVKVPASTVQLVPDTLDFITAAVVGRHGPLAFTQLRERAQLKPGEWVLVMGAAGGLGSALVQAAKYLGARVIAAADVITILGNPIDTPDNFKLALKVAAEGKLKVLIDRVLPLEEARRARNRRGALRDWKGRAHAVDLPVPAHS